MDIKNKDIVVWFSCGAASAVTAKLTIEKYGKDNNVMVVNMPVDEEDEDNRRFLKDVESWIGQEITTATNEKIGTTSCYDVWEKRKYMSGVNGAPCTMLLKKEARYQFEKRQNVDYHVLGFTANETDRYERFVRAERENTLPVLIDEGLVKGRCIEILHDNNIPIPRVYKMGYPNANCIGCVKSTSPTYWNLVREKHPEVFKCRAEQSRRLGARLVRHKGERIFLDELPATARGGKMNNYDCGIFCDTY